MKQVMKVEMYGKKLVVIQYPGKQYEFRVFSVNHLNERYHLDSFESFQEAAEFLIHSLYC